jgi:enoyl-CoA hydratase
MTALMIKESVNQAQDNMGFYNSLHASFTLHQLNHSHWAEIHESKYASAEPADGLLDWKTSPGVVERERGSVRREDSENR